MQRAFALDVLACPHCRSQLRLIGTLHDPAIIRTIGHLGHPPSEPSRGAGAASVLIRSSSGAAEAVVWAARRVIRADPASATSSRCRLTPTVRPRSIPLSLGGAAGARRPEMCAVPAAPAGGSACGGGGGRQKEGARGEETRLEGVDVTCALHWRLTVDRPTHSTEELYRMTGDGIFLGMREMMPLLWLREVESLGHPRPRVDRPAA